MRIFFASALLVGAALFFAAAASASSITVLFKIDDVGVFDYPSGNYLAALPINSTGSFTFDGDVRTVADYGSTTITQFGGVLGTTWTSPITSLIPHDPYTGFYGPFYDSYVFPNVSDYSSTFVEQGAAQANTYFGDGSNFSNYHIELRATIYSPPRNGDGTSDYAFTDASLLDFYRNFMASGAPVYFDEFFGQYTFLNGVPVYSEGRDWSTSSATIVGVSDGATQVPEPVTLGVFVAGLAGFVLMRRQRKIHIGESRRQLKAPAS